MDPQRLDAIARRHGILLLLQFGSTLTAHARPDSDLDLAVLVERAPRTLQEHGELIADLQALLPDREIDVALLNPRLHPHAWMGATVSLAVQWRVPVVCCRDADESLDVMRLIAPGRARSRSRTAARRLPAAPLTRKLFVLQGLPGVGPALARRLVERFATIERVIEADEEELCCVAGIGPSKAAAIRAMVR